MQVSEHNFCIVGEQHHKHPPTVAPCPSLLADSGHTNDRPHLDEWLNDHWEVVAPAISISLEAGNAITALRWALPTFLSSMMPQVRIFCTSASISV